jgi:hypothetical protein
MLKPGIKNMRSNFNELMTNVNSAARKKAILTLAKKHNISFAEAQQRQALRIIQAQAVKK